MHQSRTPTTYRRPTWGIIVLILTTAIGVFVSSVSFIELEDTPWVSGELSVDETTYYQYVAPRLDRLVAEMDDVSELVAGRSRNIIALSVSETQIDTLSTDIISYGEMNGVPERFTTLHQRISDGAEIATSTFGEARSALTRFDFSAMPALLTNFNDAAGMLHSAQDELTSIAGHDVQGMTQ